MIRTLSCCESLIIPYVNAKLFQIRLLKCVLDRDSRRKPDSEDMWMQSSFGTWFVRAHFGNALWSYAWVNQFGLSSWNKLLPRSAQILFVIGKAFAMLVNARSSNHDPNHEADRNWNDFRNVIRSFVNRPIHSSYSTRNLQHSYTCKDLLDTLIDKQVHSQLVLQKKNSEVKNYGTKIILLNHGNNHELLKPFCN